VHLLCTFTGSDLHPDLDNFLVVFDVGRKCANPGVKQQVSQLCEHDFRHSDFESGVGTQEKSVVFKQVLQIKGHRQIKRLFLPAAIRPAFMPTDNARQ